MKKTLEQLLKEKKYLQEQMMISEIGNDFYYSSPAHTENEKSLWLLNKQIAEIQNSTYNEEDI